MTTSKGLTENMQEGVLTLLCFSAEAAAQVRVRVAPDLFSSRVYQDVASHAIGFIDQYGAPIADHLPDLLADVLTGDDKKKAQLYERTLRNLDEAKDNVSAAYVLDHLDEFVRQQNLRQSIMSAVEKLEAGKIPEAEDELAQGLAQRTTTTDADDWHRNAPKPDRGCFYGLIGEVSAAGSERTEAPEAAIALNFITYLGVAVGRRPFMWIADTPHHARIFGAHVGRSGEGRKGDSTQLVRRIDDALRKLTQDRPITPDFPYGHAPQRHTGGLSSREGLVKLIADPPDTGDEGTQVEGPPPPPARQRVRLDDNEVDVQPEPPAEPARPLRGTDDKRLWVLESEFANVLKQAQREGNTLSSAIRDAFDGVAIAPAVKTSPIGVSRPHIGLSVGVTPGELRHLLRETDVVNGFMNRFLMVHAERSKLVSFPAPTGDNVVLAFAGRVKEIIDWVHDRRQGSGGDDLTENQLEIKFSRSAKVHYDKLYRQGGELNLNPPGPHLASLLVRRATYVHRLALLFAVSDMSNFIEVEHVDAAMAWIRLWTESVKFVFASDRDEVVAQETSAAATKVLDFLKATGRASRTDLVVTCFGGHAKKSRIDEALDELLHSTPPRIVVTTVPRTTGPGSSTKVYALIGE